MHQQKRHLRPFLFCVLGGLAVLEDGLLPPCYHTVGRLLDGRLGRQVEGIGRFDEGQDPHMLLAPRRQKEGVFLVQVQQALAAMTAFIEHEQIADLNSKPPCSK